MSHPSTPGGGEPSAPARPLPPSWAESSRFVPRAFLRPALTFMRAEAAGGVLMLLAAIVAIGWANSPWGAAYFDLFGTTIEVAVGDFHLRHLSELTVQEWINDGLMALFFFVVGLEIKRELVVGELRDPRAAALPAIAALGGMIVPALVYLAFNAGGPGSAGWGIPMATDIAFAVGVVSMLGRRVPVAAKLFLLALAIVDDLGAIVVIAIFYTSGVAAGWLVAAGVGLGTVALMRRMHVRAVSAYVLVGVLVWVAVLESGVHATVAGVALALLTPIRSFYSPRLFSARAQQLVDRADRYLPEEPIHEADHHTLERVQAVMHDLRRLSRESLPPLHRLEHALAPWASFVIVPLFALANAGVVVSGDAVAGALADPVLLGTGLGLLVGKLVGVTTFPWLAVRPGLGRLPAGTTFSHMLGIAMLAGIGSPSPCSWRPCRSPPVRRSRTAPSSASCRVAPRRARRLLVAPVRRPPLRRGCPRRGRGDRGAPAGARPELTAGRVARVPSAVVWPAHTPQIRAPDAGAPDYRGSTLPVRSGAPPSLRATSCSTSLAGAPFRPRGTPPAREGSAPNHWEGQA